MSSLAYVNARLLVDGYDMAADFNSLTVNYGAAALDKTTFGSTTKLTGGGLKTAAVAGKGFINLDSSSSDTILFNNIGGSAFLATIFPAGITENATSTAANYASAGYAFTNIGINYKMGGQVGVMLPFDIALQSASDLVRAIPLKDFTSIAATSGVTNTSPFTRLFATTCEQVYGGFHVTSLTTGSNETISAVLQSASSSGFGTTTNQISFAAQTCKAGSYATPILPTALSTDRPFWRAQITTCGSTVKGLIWVGVGPRYL